MASVDVGIDRKTDEFMHTMRLNAEAYDMFYQLLHRFMHDPLDVHLCWFTAHSFENNVTETAVMEVISTAEPGVDIIYLGDPDDEAATMPPPFVLTATGAATLTQHMPQSMSTCLKDCLKLHCCNSKEIDLFRVRKMPVWHQSSVARLDTLDVRQFDMLIVAGMKDPSALDTLLLKNRTLPVIICEPHEQRFCAIASHLLFNDGMPVDNSRPQISTDRIQLHRVALGPDDNVCKILHSVRNANNGVSHTLVPIETDVANNQRQPIAVRTVQSLVNPIKCNRIAILIGNRVIGAYLTSRMAYSLWGKCSFFSP
jgi:hypothetical protein